MISPLLNPLLRDIKRNQDGTVSFFFVSRQARDLLTLAGKILELYTYYELKNTGNFDSVVSSCEINWEGANVVNEFDCIMIKGFRTFFVECKTRPLLDQNYYYKLDVLTRRFGVNAAAFLVVFIQKVSFFSNAWERDFFAHDDPRMKRNRMMIFSFLMVLTVVIVAGIYMSASFVSEAENAIFYIGFEFFFSLVYIFISFIMLKMLVEYYILSDISEQEKQHQKELKSFIKMIRAQRHDFNLHLHAVNGLLEAGKYEECKSYVTKMVAETEYVNEVLPIHDTSISALLYAYRSDAESSGIKMTFDITTNLRGLAPEAYEINRIIGNLLQNAIDALVEQTDRNYGIHVRMYETADSAVVDVSNRFFGDTEELSHFFEYSYSGKKNHEGLGLSTVRRIAESYKGVAYVEVDEDIIHFIVHLPKRSKVK